MEWKEQAPNPSPHATFLMVIAMLNKLRLKDFKGDEGTRLEKLTLAFICQNITGHQRGDGERLQAFFAARCTIDTKHAVARQGFAVHSSVPEM